MSIVAYADAAAGCAGDMFLGALVDAGLQIEVLGGVVDALGLEGVEVREESVRRGAFTATKVHVLVDGCPHEHRGLTQIRGLIDAARDLSPAARSNALRTFEVLAEAEARVHGVGVDEVHFHEVGAVDALVDVVGTCVGLDALHVEELHVGPLPWSRGTVETQHGRLPLPAPAVVHLLEGHPTFPSGEEFEQVTPTGAALLRALGRGIDVPAGFVPRRVGVGAGTRDKGRLPNVLRLVLGERQAEATPSDAVLLEANLDDVTGQIVARAVERALVAGALDAWSAPITMKKGRPGILLSVLAMPADVDALVALLFRETPTLGVRRRIVQRTVLARRHVEVATPWGTVRVKVRETPDGPEATPEHDDCVSVAEAADVPLQRVLAEAMRGYARLDPTG